MNLGATFLHGCWATGFVESTALPTGCVTPTSDCFSLSVTVYWLHYIKSTANGLCNANFRHFSSPVTGYRLCYINSTAKALCTANFRSFSSCVTSFWLCNQQHGRSTWRCVTSTSDVPLHLMLQVTDCVTLTARSTRYVMRCVTSISDVSLPFCDTGYRVTSRHLSCNVKFRNFSPCCVTRYRMCYIVLYAVLHQLQTFSILCYSLLAVLHRITRCVTSTSDVSLCFVIQITYWVTSRYVLCNVKFRPFSQFCVTDYWMCYMLSNVNFKCFSPLYIKSCWTCYITLRAV